MNKNQSNKNATDKLIEVLFDNNAPAFLPIPGLTGYIAEFKANNALIDDKAALQVVDHSGLTQSKDTGRTKVTELTIEISDALQAYAVVAEKPELGIEAKVTITALRKLTANELNTKVRSIYDLAVLHAEPLLNFATGAEKLAAFSAQIGEYSKSIPRSRLSIAEQKEVTADLDKLIVKNDELLKKTDKLVELLKKSSPLFYNEYRNLRKVIPYGKRSLAMQGWIRDAFGKAIPQTEIAIVAAGDDGITPRKDAAQLKVLKRSGAKGGFNVKSLAEGKYILTISKLGYKTQVVYINVIHGELCRVTVVLISE